MGAVDAVLAEGSLKTLTAAVGSEEALEDGSIPKTLAGLLMEDEDVMPTPAERAERGLKMTSDSPAAWSAGEMALA